MKILQVNKYHYARGGADIFYLDLGERLAEAGNEVAYFSMQHPLNIPSPWSKYFVSRVSFNTDLHKYALKIPGRTIYSVEARKRFAKLLDDFQPDIIHVHNIYHHLSPSILLEASKRGIPTVMHAHDYKLVCPNHSLFVDGQPCQRCIPGKYYNCAIHRCIKKSVTGSLLASLEMYLHNTVFDLYRKHLKAVIAPSRFMKQILLAGGWPEEQVVVINNSFQPISPILESANERKAYFLFFGRLSAEKGIAVAIKAISKVNDAQLVIAGDGDEADDLRALAEQLKLSERVKFVGQKDKEGIRQLIQGAIAVIIPSIWYENFPLSALESLSLGTPVIASDIGGLPEIVNEGNGLLVPANDSAALAEAINRIQNNEVTFNQEAIIQSAGKYLPKYNTDLILQLYQTIIAKQKNSV